jgi:uncharacterized membrane protein (UPF0127 family)
MRVLRAANRRGPVLGDRIAVADRWWPRFKGLLGRRGLEPGEGLWLKPCRAVHMLGMRFPLDVAFLDHEGNVVAAYPNLGPGTRTAWHPRADSALELPAGTLAGSGTREGDQIVWTEETRP